MNRFFYFFLGIILTCVLAALFWASKTHQETVEGLPTLLIREFHPFLAPDRIIDVNLGDVQKRAEALMNEYGYIQEIIIRKEDRNGVKRTLFPLTYDIDHPGFPPQRNASYVFKLVMDRDQFLGELYIRIDAQRSRLFQGAINGSIAALLIVALLGVYTLRSKEEEVRKTTTLLEEKQRELIHIERLALVGQITANLLHDLKKPVLNIRAEAENLPKGGPRRTIEEETDLFLNLLRDLRLESFLQHDAERAEFIDVGETILRSLRLVRYAQNNVSVEFNLPEELPFLFGQRHHLIQIFSNILLNAFQALNGEGSILIRAGRVTEDDEDCLEIAFSDDGPGIPAEAAEHIFEPFFSSRRESDSTGLGLYITKSLVESMGGVIAIHSIPKHGCTFTLRFPLSEEEKN